MIIYNGPSNFNGAPILGVITGLDKKSNNPKTGPMAQLWILDGLEHPVQAVRSGNDASICGDCKWRGSETLKRACYVNVGFAPSQIWKVREKYPTSTAEHVNEHLRRRGMSLRLGAYGDPAALPLDLIEALVKDIKYTGYTHAWKQPNIQTYQKVLMASVDSPEEMREALSLGWRTFRVRLGYEPLQEQEIVCPASKEAGFRSTCIQCNLCDGARPDDTRRNIAIIAHGSGAKFVQVYRNGVT